MSEQQRRQASILEKLLKKEENRYCADCRRKSPSWASMNLGVFICIKCAGFHREMGTHITKIKSVNLDLWPKGIPELFTKIDNKIANSYWEASLKDESIFNRIQNDDNLLRDFIYDKYSRCRYVKGKGKPPMVLIYEGKSPVGENNTKDNDLHGRSISDSPVVHHQVNKPTVNAKPTQFSLTSKKNPPSTVINKINENLIDFNDISESKHNNSDSNFYNPEETKEKSNFTFINTTKHKASHSTVNLMEDLNFIAAESPRETVTMTQDSSSIEHSRFSSTPNYSTENPEKKLLDLSENLSKLYSNNEPELHSKQNTITQNIPINNYFNVTQPKINIHNNFYNNYPNPSNFMSTMSTANPNINTFNSTTSSNYNQYGQVYNNYRPQYNPNAFISTNDLYQKPNQTPNYNNTYNFSSNNTSPISTTSSTKPKEPVDPFKHLLK